MVYGIRMGGRGEVLYFPNSLAIVLQQCRHYRWARGMKGRLIHAQTTPCRRISCKGQDASNTRKPRTLPAKNEISAPNFAPNLPLRQVRTTPRFLTQRGVSVHTHTHTHIYTHTHTYIYIYLYVYQSISI